MQYPVCRAARSPLHNSTRVLHSNTTALGNIQLCYRLWSGAHLYNQVKWSNAGVIKLSNLRNSSYSDRTHTCITGAEGLTHFKYMCTVNIYTRFTTDTVSRVGIV